MAEYYKQNGDNEFARDLKNDFANLDNYIKFLASQRLENSDDFSNYQLLKIPSPFETHINGAPIRDEDDAKLYPNLETQQIFGPED